MTDKTYARFAIADGVAMFDLGKGRYTKVDACVLPELRDYTLLVVGAGYITAAKRIPGTSKYMRVYLHRLLTGCPDNMVVDHINHDKMDNRLCNLRVCTQAENNRNTRGRWKRYSIYKGVTYVAGESKPWKAGTTMGGKSYWFGTYATEAEAAIAYNNGAVKLFGKFACLNAVPGYEVPGVKSDRVVDFDDALDNMIKLQRQEAVDSYRLSISQAALTQAIEALM